MVMIVFLWKNCTPFFSNVLDKMIEHDEIYKE